MIKLALGKFKFGNVRFKEPVVVIEIGNDWLKIVEHIPSSKGGRVNKVVLKKLSQIKDSVAGDIAHIFSEAKFNKRSAVLCMPRHLLSVRTLELPSTNPKEVADMVNLQIGKQTPYSKEEIVAAHRIVGSEREGFTKVMLVIVQRALITERVDTMQKAGIVIGKVTLSSDGVCGWFKAAYPEAVKSTVVSSIILLDIDSNYSDFLIIRKGEAVFTKSIFIGANHLIEQFEAWQEKFIEELKRAIERYQSEEKSVKLERIYLSGAAKNIPNLERLIAANLGMPTENANISNNMNVVADPRLIGDADSRFVSLTPLIGSAINDSAQAIDLTPHDHRIMKIMEVKRSQLMIMGALFASIMMMASVLFLGDIYNKNTALTQLKQKIAKVERESGDIEKMRLGINLVAKRLDARGSSINILSEIAHIMPPDVSFSDMDIEENQQIVLRGRASAMSSIFKFVKTLEDSQMFENVKAKNATTKKEKKDDRDIEYAEFEITCSCQR